MVSHFAESPLKSSRYVKGIKGGELKGSKSNRQQFGLHYEDTCNEQFSQHRLKKSYPSCQIPQSIVP